MGVNVSRESLVSAVYDDLKGKGLVSPEDKELCIQDINYHLDYLEEAIRNTSPELFEDYVLWADVLLRNLGLPEECLRGSLKSIEKVMMESLDDETASLASGYISGSLRKLEMEHKPPSYIRDQPLRDLAERYLELVLNTEAKKARDLIISSLESGVNVEDIYLHVFEPVQHEIGRLWQTNQISVAHEHYATSVTQMIMSELYPYIYRASDRKNLRLVAACVNNELHEIGIRMVSDFFEINGWDSVYLGANTPPEDCRKIVDELKPDLVAVSATMTFNVGHVRSLIELFGELDDAPPIMVGGYPFNVDTDLWRKVGADLHAASASSAVRVAEEFLGIEL
ncbi:B12-binding domain-containing protein [Methanothermobacter sp. K4]|uniref:cobalamin B12-binding domain-containing protein n=1 Tax=Methanothermobacter sp. K4 TaxID=2913262 RepID=UPI001EDBE018|nr:B12-binding domain-containing protein [Methanothermobacter sp. K4]MCG2829033.1 B12-binding domain-containing protein [Methanothermobacter sp. K4]